MVLGGLLGNVWKKQSWRERRTISSHGREGELAMELEKADCHLQTEVQHLGEEGGAKTLMLPCFSSLTGRKEIDVLKLVGAKGRCRAAC